MEEVDRRRSRSLASEQRAGSWSRRRAAEEQFRFLRENPRFVLVLLLMYAVPLPGTWFLPSWARGFFLGAWTASIAWLGVLFTWKLSGVGYLQQGELAEQWTMQQVKPLTRQGWHLINHVLLRPWDIDHLLLGPVGVIVVETKGGNSDWTEARHGPRIRDAVKQARANAHDSRRFLRSVTGDVPVYPVVALWPAREDIPTREVEGVMVLSGHRLRAWVESLPGEALDAEQAVAGWQRIADHLERRDAYDVDRHGRVPRTMERLAFDFAQYPLGMGIGIVLVPAVTRSMIFPLSLLAMLGAGLVATLAARRLSAVARLLRGIALATVAFVLVFAAFVIADLVS